MDDKRYLLGVFFSLALILVAVLSFKPPSTSRAAANTEVGGPIISDTTWTLANSPYIVIENIEVWEAVTLTIEAGVEVRFYPQKQLKVDGQLIAQGTSGAPITFTSNQPEPRPADWTGILFSNTSVDAELDENGDYLQGSVLQTCIVNYGGGEDDTSAAVVTRDAAPLIEGCNFQGNAPAAMNIVGTDANPVIVRDNLVMYNGRELMSSPAIVATNAVVSGNVVGYHVVGAYETAGILAISSRVETNSVFNNHGGGLGAWEDSLVVNNRVYDNAGSGISISTSTARGNSVLRNGSTGLWCHGGGTLGGGQDGFVENNIIKDNIITDAYSVSGGGIYAWNCLVKSNLVQGNLIDGSASGGAGISARGSRVISNTIISNVLSGGSSGAAGISFNPETSSQYELRGNVIIGNRTIGSDTGGGVVITTGLFGTADLGFHRNALYGNEPHDVTVVGGDDIDGTDNYWGTTESVNIVSQIYDWHDNSNRGRLLFLPYLQDPDPNAPVPPPLNVSAMLQDNSAIVKWDPIPSTATGYGYKLYYDTDMPGPPYSGTSSDAGASPIDVGTANEKTLTGLSDNTYYITVTGYDTLGRESWYATEVRVELTDEQKIYLPIVLSD